MPHNNQRSLCKKCGRVFALDSSESPDYCDQCYWNIFYQSKRSPNRICSKCKEAFYSPNSTKKCPFCTVKNYDQGSKNPKDYSEINLKKRKKRTGISVDESIRRMEHKRVWDDEGWDHYLKGRKWDKI